MHLWNHRTVGLEWPLQPPQPHPCGGVAVPADQAAQGPSVAWVTSRDGAPQLSVQQCQSQIAPIMNVCPV